MFFKISIGLVYLFNGISTSYELFNAKFDSFVNI